MTQLRFYDTTMTQLDPLMSWKPMTLMTQVLKSRLRVRARRPGSRKCVINVMGSPLFFSYDTHDTSFGKVHTRTPAGAHTPPRSEPLKKPVMSVMSVIDSPHPSPGDRP